MKKTLKTPKKRKKITKNDILLTIERIIERKIFRPAAIAILVSFALFNGTLYVKNYIADKKERELKKAAQSPIEIKLVEDGKVLDFDQMQIVERRVKSGDTILSFLADLEVEEDEVFAVLAALKKVYDPRLITSGNSMIARYRVKVDYDEKLQTLENVRRDIVLSEFEVIVSPELQYVVKRLENGQYVAKEFRQVLVQKISKYEGVIKNGLFLDAVDAGASPNAVMNMINLYSYDIDFARDIKDGDKFEILVESYFTEGGKKVRDGNVLFSLIDLGNRKVETYAHRVGGSLEYFDKNGNSTKKSLLRTPINGARVSSGYGLRRHPVLGYSKMHKGIDFAAPTGTPVLAAGNGVIVYRDRFGSYGNFVRIKHGSGYDTAYAHLSRFSNRFNMGSKVKQGDVIAYVGTTGRSTGPHLHFELKQGGKVVNPSEAKSVSGMKLSGAELRKYEANKKRIDGLRKKTSKAK